MALIYFTLIYQENISTISQSSSLDVSCFDSHVARLSFVKCPLALLYRLTCHSSRVVTFFANGWEVSGGDWVVLILLCQFPSPRSALASTV